jgi:hypothetical protein
MGAHTRLNNMKEWRTTTTQAGFSETRDDNTQLEESIAVT